jgi:hypothetical protein
VSNAFSFNKGLLALSKILSPFYRFGKLFQNVGRGKIISLFSSDKVTRQYGAML